MKTPARLPARRARLRDRHELLLARGGTGDTFLSFAGLKQGDSRQRFAIGPRRGRLGGIAGIIFVKGAIQASRLLHAGAVTLKSVEGAPRLATLDDRLL